jgi:hypothetical protein
VSSSSAPPPPVSVAAVTVRVTVVVGEAPAELLQVSVYVKVPSVSGVSVLVPLAARTPVQPEETAFELPLAVQEVALADDHVIVSELSAGTEVFSSVSVGAAGAATAAVAVSVTEVAGEEPPLLLQAKVNVSVPTAVGVMVSVPLVARVPLQLPEAVQLNALVEDQLSVVDLPTATELAARASVGTPGGVPEVAARVAELAAAVPEALEQVKVYVVVPAAVGVTITLPLVASLPLQPPEATQLEAWMVDQASVVEPPSAIDGAPKVSVGTMKAVSARMNP